jgi:hypothetical protein
MPSVEAHDAFVISWSRLRALNVSQEAFQDSEDNIERKEELAASGGQSFGRN